MTPGQALIAVWEFLRTVPYVTEIIQIGIVLSTGIAIFNFFNSRN